MKVFCMFAANCAISAKDCLHKKPHEKLEFACRVIFCCQTRRKVGCMDAKRKKEKPENIVSLQRD